MKRIVVVGAGNVAFHLAPALERAGHQIVGLYSRTAAHAQAIALQGEAELLDSPDLEKTTADWVLLSVSDDAYESLLPQLKLPEGALLLHTSGSQPMSLLKKYHDRVGVFYPLQTFSKAKPVNFREVLFCLEAVKDTDLADLQQTAQALQAPFREVSSQQREQMHVAAVFACNFANHVWTMAEEVLVQKGLEFRVLEPLLRETLEKALVLTPSKAQTGPAIREDQVIIEKHLKRLEGMPESYTDLYQRFTALIQAKKKS